MATPTAKRRWSRELSTRVDGIAFASEGPVVVHGYEAPIDDVWKESVIPGKLSAFDRRTGEPLWTAVCEVGYGPGLGMGVVSAEEVLVLGPCSSGQHLSVRTSLRSGREVHVGEIPPFHHALVAADMSVCLSPSRVFALDSEGLHVTWEHGREGERYHHIQRADDLVLVGFSETASGHHGVLRLDAETGTCEGVLIEPRPPVIHGMAATHEGLVLLTSDLMHLLEGDAVARVVEEVLSHPDGGDRDTLSLVAVRIDGEPGDQPTWQRVLDTGPIDELPEASILENRGKLYLERGAFLEALDLMTGRKLGEWTVPGLDLKVGWGLRVESGAGLLAEETRVSVFELPA